MHQNETYFYALVMRSKSGPRIDVTSKQYGVDFEKEIRLKHFDVECDDRHVSRDVFHSVLGSLVASLCVVCTIGRGVLQSDAKHCAEEMRRARIGIERWLVDEW